MVELVFPSGGPDEVFAVLAQPGAEFKLIECSHNQKVILGVITRPNEPTLVASCPAFEAFHGNGDRSKCLKLYLASKGCPIALVSQQDRQPVLVISKDPAPAFVH